MKICLPKKSTQLIKAFSNRKVQVVKLDWHANDWHQKFSQAKVDAFVWFPGLHHQWFKMLDRAGFINLFLNKPIFSNLNDSYLFQDKMHQQYVFESLNLPTPKTKIITNPEELKNYFNTTKLPIIIKDIYGFGGDAPKMKKPGLIIIKTRSEANKFFKAKKWPKYNDQINNEDYIFAQQLENIDTEFRIVTVGQKIILTYQKKSDDLIKHVWRGAEVIYQSDKKAEALVRRANKKLKLDWCGWDIIKTKNNQYKILEINPVFGTKGLEEKGIIIEEHMADYVISKLKK